MAVLLLADMVFASLSAMSSDACADDWSLVRPDGKEGDKGKKGEGKGGNKGKKAKKKGKKAKDPNLGTDPAAGSVEAGPGKGEDEPGPAAVPPGLEEVVDTLEMLLEDPVDDFLIGHLMEAGCALEGGPDGAVAAAAAAVPSIGSNPSLPIVVSMIDIHEGRPEEAVETLDGLLSDDPGNPVVSYCLALALRASGKPADALAILEKAVDGAGKSSIPSLKGRILGELVALAVLGGDASAAGEHFVGLCKETGELPSSFEEILALHAISDAPDAAVGFVDAVLDARSWDGYERYYLLVEEARLLEDAGKPDDALGLLVKALKVFPPDSPDCQGLVDTVMGIAGNEKGVAILLKGKKASCFYVNAALTLESGGDVAGALAILEKGAKKFPGDPGIFMARVDVLMRSGEVGTATALLEQKSSGKETDPLVVVKLAEVLVETGDKKKAISVLGELGKGSKSVELHQVLEQFYDSIDEQALALAENRVLVELLPDDPETLVRLAERLYSEGKFDEALSLWKKVPDLYAIKAEGLLRLGDVLLDHGRVSEANQAYKAAIDDGGAGVEALKKMALLYDMTNNPGEAEKWWRAVMDEPGATFGTKWEASMRLVQMWTRLGIIVQKLPLAEKLAADGPDRIELGILLANAYLEVGRSDDCRGLLAGLLDRLAAAVAKASPLEKPDLLDAADHVIATLDRLNRLEKQWAKAMEVFTLAASLFPDRLPQLELKAAEYAILAGKHDEARAAIDEALAAAPADAEIHEKAADLMFKIGDVEGAAASLSMVVARDPSRYDVALELSRALIHLGRDEEAARWLKGIVEGCPYDDLSTDALSVLVTLSEGKGIGFDLEEWLFKIYYGTSDRGFASKYLLEIYATRLGVAEAHHEGLYAQQPAASKKAAVAVQGWEKRAAKTSSRVLAEGPEDARLDALHVFSSLHDPEAATNLLKRAAYLKSGWHQVAAIVAASGSVSPEHAGLLEPFLASDNPEVRAAATLCIAFTGDPGRLADLEERFFDPSPEVRAASVLATGLLMSRTGVGVDASVSEPIMTLLRTRQWQVTYQSTIVALGVMGGPEAAELLMNFATSRGKVEPDGAAPIALDSGSAESLTLRLTLLTLAAGSFEGPDVTGVLVDGCWSQDGSVRDTAGYAVLMETSVPGSVVRPLPAGIPVTHGLEMGRFRLSDVLESFALVPAYTLDADALGDLAPWMATSLDERLAMHAAAGVLDNDGMDSVMETMAVLDEDQSGPSFLPFSGHLVAGHQDEGRALIGRMISERLDAIGVVLDLVVASPAADRDLALLRFLSLLAKVGGKVPPPSLAALVGGGETQAMTVAAIGTLAAFDSSDTVDALRSILHESPWNVRLAVVEALGRLEDPAAKDLLEVISVDDRSAVVRQAAIDILGGA